MDPLPVRLSDDGHWQVFTDSPPEWRNCLSEEDARLISDGLHLSNLSIGGGGDFTEEQARYLERAADAIERNIGQCMAQRFCLSAAADIREKLKDHGVIDN